MTSNPSVWQYMFTPDVNDNRAAGEQRKIKLIPSAEPLGNILEVSITVTSSGAVDKRYFRLTEVSPTWKDV